MREKLITLSYIYNGNISKMEDAIKTKKHISINKTFIYSLKKSNINTITIVDDYYPKQLLQLHNPPLVLYTLGNINLLNEKMSAIIGSRKNSQYSKQVCMYLVASLSCSTVIVSGMARGIDSLAHRFAIKHNMKTIAVLGCGFEKIYPSENQSLADELALNHLMISEYPPNCMAARENFPLRNRIIAALCEDLYVIEAAQNSGSLITANIALDLGRDIYCAPGSVFNKQYIGSHRLINDGAYLLEFGNEVKI